MLKKYPHYSDDSLHHLHLLLQCLFDSVLSSGGSGGWYWCAAGDYRAVQRSDAAEWGLWAFRQQACTVRGAQVSGTRLSEEIKEQCHVTDSVRASGLWWRLEICLWIHNGNAVICKHTQKEEMMRPLNLAKAYGKPLSNHHSWHSAFLEMFRSFCGGLMRSQIFFKSPGIV